MSFEELEFALSRLISFPLKSQIKIDFNKPSKFFRLSVIIYRNRKQIPSSIQNYVNARSGMTFQPHQTFFQNDHNQIEIVQEIPFQWGFQPTLRRQILDFHRLAKQCHQIMMEMASEEKFARYLEG
jgi:hypothetical protein